MSVIADKLREEANELQTAQDTLEWQQTKLAAVQVLSGSGVPASTSYSILNGLEEQVKQASEEPKIKDFAHYSTTMIKSADYIEELEAKIASISGELDTFKHEKSAGVKSHLSKKGFDPDEVEGLLGLPASTLQKVAGVLPEPAWEMGKVASSNYTNHSGLDAVTAWLMNSQ